MNTVMYPAAPSGFTQSITLPSASFKKQVIKAVVSIALFFMVYVALVLAAFVLAAFCLYGSFSIIILHPSFLSVILALGLAGVGVSVIYFLLKFIFAVSRDENPARVEIFEDDQPRLFAFIRELTRETHTPFPKKIFVSPDVNACVFYHSSFWSMFLPVRKNLEIGLGLVNSINLSEFKAVMAHEFGHFSQRSMKLGSFTYNVNRVIFNMLYDNTGYTGFLNSWGRLNGYLSIFAHITVYIARGIQWILRGMYKLINKSYLGLSREMEFHADTMAATVAGGNNLVAGLSRVEIAQNCYDSAINKANEWLKQNKIARNIFDNQLTVFRSLAEEYQLPEKEGLPEVSYHFIASFSRSRINYKNQWASHPTLEERKAHLDKIGINCVADERKAWLVFNNGQKLQETLTANLYESVKLETTPEVYDSEYFEACRIKERDAYTLPSVYKGFYDKRFIDAAGWDIQAIVSARHEKKFDEIFTDTNGQLHASLKSNESDLGLIKAIKERQIDTKSFDFDGAKHKLKDCDKVIGILEAEIKDQANQLALLDKEAFSFFYAAAGQSSPGLKEVFLDYQLAGKQHDIYIDIANNVMSVLNPFYQGGLTVDQIRDSVKDLKVDAEAKLKESFRLALEHGIITEKSNEPVFNHVKSFLEKDYAYFVFEFQNAELNELRDITCQVADEWSTHKFGVYKKLLEKQLEYYHPDGKS